MSFFYLSPVKGELPVYILENIVTTRLNYLKHLLEGNVLHYNEYMVEGSIYDNIGHYMMCIIVILYGSSTFSSYFVKAETELFTRRSQSFSAYDLRSFAKTLIRTIKKYEQHQNISKPLEKLCQHFVVKELVQHVSSHDPDNCIKHHIPMNFRYCLSFISKREVELKNGIAYIPCSKWKKCMQTLFTKAVINRLSTHTVAVLQSDSRVMYLVQKLRPHIQGLSIDIDIKNVDKVLSADVDRILNYYPPCMLNLHNKLRKRHRLSHMQRFYYSLFLKDIGMPLEEAIKFWKQEYEKIPDGVSPCCHNWENNENKYLYGIRHMYGLEGGRKKYTSVNCKCIQSSDSQATEGGCIFKSFDEVEMLQVIGQRCEGEALSQIKYLKEKKQYTSACKIYLSCVNNNLQRNCDYSSFNFSPVNFYYDAKNK